MGFIEDIIGENIYLQFIKWTIPLFIFSIYIIRGYAHIKNSPKYRTYSSSIIIYYVVIEIYIIIINLISSKLTITIGNVNLIELFFTFVITVFIVSYLRKIHDALKIRYNY